MQLPTSIQTRKALNTSSISSGLCSSLEFHIVWKPHLISYIKISMDCTKETEKNTNSAKKVVEDN